MKLLLKFFPADRIKLLWLGIALAAVLVMGFMSYQINQLQREADRLSGDLGQLRKDQQETSKSLKDIIVVLEENLSLTKSEQEKLRSALNTEQAKVKAQEAQLQNISGTVGTLEKLTYTDEELLQKYSKVYFLNENYIPTKLSRIDPKYSYRTKKDFQIHASVLPYLEDLLNGDNNKDFDLRIISAYRSFGTQADLKSAYKMIYGATSANQFSADQGYSEHQLGTTVDFTTALTKEDYSSFKDTYDYKWLLNNAYKYGFILSYPENNAYYKFEPWHWRFVGVKLATKLHDENKHFYDLDQREIDTYLVSIFD